MQRVHVFILLLFGCLQSFGFHVIPDEYLNIRASPGSPSEPAGGHNPLPDANKRMCSPPRHGDQSQKRAELVENAGNQTVWKRMKLPPAGRMGEFMIQETMDPSGEHYPIIWNRPTGTGGERADYNTATFVPFRPYIQDGVEFSVSTGGLKGCTILAIISRRAVYIAHYWESIVFAPDEEDLERYGSMDRIFDLFVKKGLEQGVGRGQNKAQDRLPANEIDDEYIRAYLLVPTDNHDATTQGYPNEWDKIKRVVNTIIPRLGEENGRRWTTITYVRVGTDEDLLDTFRGRCLFKFDPQHPNRVEDKRRKKAMFWSEDKLRAIHSDEWD